VCVCVYVNMYVFVRECVYTSFVEPRNLICELLRARVCVRAYVCARAYVCVVHVCARCWLASCHRTRQVCIAVCVSIVKFVLLCVCKS